MKRYNTQEDAIPHEVNVAIFSKAQTCYDAPFGDVIDEVREGVSCDELLIGAYYQDPDEITDYNSLIQNGVWLLHHDSLFPEEKYPHLESFLKTQPPSIGRQTIVCVDVANDEKAVRTRDHLKRTYDEQIYIVTSRTELVSYMLGYLAAVNPCTLAGREYIIKWNNETCDALGIL